MEAVNHGYEFLNKKSIHGGAQCNQSGQIEPFTTYKTMIHTEKTLFSGRGCAQPQRPQLIRKSCLGVLAAVLSLAPLSSDAAIFTVYSYSRTNSNLSWDRTPSIGDNNYTDSGFNVADDQATRMTTILNTGWVTGSASRARGADVSEDWEFNWIIPALAEGSSPGNNGRWLPLEGNGVYNSQYNAALTTANTGGSPNASFRNNPDLIAMDSEGAIFLDLDNTLSFYNHLSGGLAANWTWTNLSGGGSLGTANTALSVSLIENHFIGSEDGWIGFLVGDNTVEYYNRANGAFEREVDYSTATEGPLSQYSLAAIIDGQAGGFRYLGLDVGPVIVGGLVIPEPSAALLALCSAGLLIRRRRATA